MAHHAEGRSPEAVLPLRPIDLQILLILLEDDLHGYGLMKAVEEQSAGRVRLEVGSLYRVIKRLLTSELIDEAAAARELAGEAKRRRNYTISEFGREVAAAEVDRLVDVVELARNRQLVASRKKA